MRTRQERDEAVSTVISFLVAGFIFIAAIGMLLFTSDTMGTDGAPVDEAGQDVGVQGLADLLAANEGLGWAAGADGVDRLGLLADDGAGLDPEKLDALRGAL